MYSLIRFFFPTAGWYVSFKNYKYQTAGPLTWEKAKSYKSHESFKQVKWRFLAPKNYMHKPVRVRWGRLLLLLMILLVAVPVVSHFVSMLPSSDGATYGVYVDWMPGKMFPSIIHMNVAEVIMPTCPWTLDAEIFTDHRTGIMVRQYLIFCGN